MREKIGKNEARNFRTKNTVIMIVSMLAVTLFVGITIHPVMSGSIPYRSLEPDAVEEECLPCKSCSDSQESSRCKTCVDAVIHAVNYMKDHVKTTFKDKGWYLMRSVDASILIFEGIVLGLKDSGFKIEIDFNDLNVVVDYWVNKLCKPQIFGITKFLARLGAISIGITWYLLSLCKDNSQIIPNVNIKSILSQKQVIPQFLQVDNGLNLLKI